MANTPVDLPAREQLELFSASGQGATQTEQTMAKKSQRKADKADKGDKKAAAKATKKAAGGAGGGGGGGSTGGGGDGMGTPGTHYASLEAEARRRYLNYALSVITSRALPDVRDGLKPVQRRIL